MQSTLRLTDKPNSKTTTYVALLFISLFTLSAQTADTDIYIKYDENTVISDPDKQPNLLLMLDTSETMNEPFDGVSGKTKMEKMKETLTQIINQAKGVNIGLGRTSSDGGTILFPVSNLDDTIFVDKSGEAENIELESSEENCAIELNTRNAPTELSNPHSIYNLCALELRYEDEEVIVPDSVSYRTVSISPNARACILNRKGTGDGPGNSERTCSDHWIGRPNAFPNDNEFGAAIPLDQQQHQAHLYEFRNVESSLALGPKEEIFTYGLEINTTKSNQQHYLYRGSIEKAGFDWNRYNQETGIRKNELKCKDNKGNLYLYTGDNNNSLSTIANSLANKDDNWELLWSGANIKAKTECGAPALLYGNSNKDKIKTNAPVIFYASAPAGSYVHYYKKAFYGAEVTPTLKVRIANNGNTKTEKKRITVYSGMRFQNVNIPQGAKITKATFIGKTQQYYLRDAKLDIRPDMTGNAEPFGVKPSDLKERFNNRNSGPHQKTLTIPRFRKAHYKDSSRRPYTVNINLTQQVQAIVNQQDWCGGNAMAFISLSNTQNFNISYKLQISSVSIEYTTNNFDADKATGCAQTDKEYKIISADDDETYIGDTIDTTKTNVLTLGPGTEIKLDYHNVDLLPTDKIVDAYLEYYNTKQTYTDMTIQLREEDTQPLKLGGSPNSKAGTGWKTLHGLSGVISNMIQSNDFKQSGTLPLSIKGISAKPSSLDLEMMAFDGDPEKAPILSVKIERDLAIQPLQEEVSIRDHLIHIIDNLEPFGDRKPLPMALREAGLYMQGMEVDCGRYRAPAAERINSHNASVYNGYRTSIPLSYRPEDAPVFMPDQCTSRDSSSEDCWKEHIETAPTYASPIKDRCQASHIVLFSDNVSNYFENADQNKIRSMTSQNCSGSESCEQALANYLSSQDISFEQDGIQSVKVHTVGVALDNTADTDKPAIAALKAIANQGRGVYLEANNAADLLEQFKNVLREEIIETAQTYVAPVVSTNAFNQLLIGSDVYFSVFSPSSQQRWSGNLKRYRFKGGVLTGENDKPAVVGGQFSSEVQSIWSTSVDGHIVTAGGAGGKLLDKGYSNRKIYTYLDLDNVDNPLNIGLRSSNDYSFNSSLNNALNAAELWPEGMTTQVIKSTINWARGRDIDDEDGDGQISDTRWAFCAPLHAQVIAVNYNQNNTRLFLPTNCGVMHFINAQNGNETWAFIPAETFAQQPALRTNATGDPIYTIDGQPSLLLRDNNHDGEIKAGDNDKAIIYVPFRRGGNLIYALDVTKPNAPKLLWRISSQVPGFEALGQTWSRLAVTKVKYNGASKDVVIFGGGYSNAYEDATFRGRNTGGEAVYIVDAETGKLLLSIGGSGNEDIHHEEMDFPIVSSISVQDLRDGDTLTDRLYFGDLGGNLWRVDLQDDLAAGGHLVERIASLGTDENPRRFYYPPLVTYFSKIGQDKFQYLYLLISSGDREHPFNREVEDAIFAIKDRAIGPLQTGFTERRYTQDNLYNATENRLQDGETKAARLAEKELLDDADGWYIRLVDTDGNAIGEKGLSSGKLDQGVWYLTTYLKSLTDTNESEETRVCGTSHLGRSQLYALNLDGGQAIFEDNLTGGSWRQKRTFAETTSGIAEGITEVMSEQDPSNTEQPECALGFGMTYIPRAQCSNSTFLRAYWWQ